MAGLIILSYILPLTFADNFLSHTTPETFFQLIQPAWILLLTSSSHYPSLLTVEPRCLKFYTLVTTSLAISTLLQRVHLQLLNIRFCSGSISGLFSPMHFSKFPSPPLALYDFAWTVVCHLQTSYPMALLS